jgi:hypothetical protein
MRTAQILLSGFLLLAAIFILARLFSHNFPTVMKVAVVAFIALWLAIVSFNMWVGVVKAGYSFAEELPVLFVLFLPPAIVAAILAWRLK